jgi:radical SAM superfamily enzyme YgiQ (UPF0313 family)
VINKLKKIVLLHPPLSPEERYGALSGSGSFAPPLGLAILASVARSSGLDVRIIDAACLGLSYQEAADEILKESPDLLGITAVTISIHNAARVAKLVKESKTDFPIVLGGAHLTAIPFETMKKFPSFDLGVVGEGEETLKELLDALKSGHDLNGVPGLILRDNDQLVSTGRRPYIKDLDEVPLPAWDLLPYLPKYYRPPLHGVKHFPATSIVTSRGCPNQCTFCDRSLFGNRLREFSAEYVLKMIKYLHFNYGIRDLLIDDDNFVVFRRRLEKLTELLKKENLSLSWSCNARVDLVNPRMLKLMKEAGCWQISYGIESGSQKILDLVKKSITLERIEQALRWTREAGIKSKGFFMLGYPTETVETMQETIDFACKLPLDDAQFAMFTPLPGTEVSMDILKYGTFENDWQKMNCWYPAFIPNGLTREDLESYSRLAFKRFYLRPRIIYEYIKEIFRNTAYAIKLIRGGATLAKYWWLKPKAKA